MVGKGRYRNTKEGKDVDEKDGDFDENTWTWRRKGCGGKRECGGGGYKGDGKVLEGDECYFEGK